MTIHYNYRCGEIYFSDANNSFVFICKFCDQQFNKFESFSDHKILCFPSQETTCFVDIIKCTSIKENENFLKPFDQSKIITINNESSIITDETTNKIEDNLHNLEETNIDVNTIKKDISTENQTYFENYIINYDVSNESRETMNQKRNKKSLKLKLHIMCDICFQPFPTNDDLVLHKSNLHSNGNEDASKVKLFSCQICLKKFARYGRLKIHINQIHKGDSLEQYIFDEKPYKCTVCPAEFRRMNTLRIHVRKHTGDKPYKCEKCSKGFASRDALNTHFQNHTHEKLYCCELCRKTYLKASGLLKHKKKHLPPNPSD